MGTELCPFGPRHGKELEMAEAMGINHAVVMEVRDLIKTRGMSISGLARMTGISRGTLVNYITRERSSMPVDVMGKVAQAFGMTLDELAARAETRRAGASSPDRPWLRGLWTPIGESLPKSEDTRSVQDTP